MTQCAGVINYELFNELPDTIYQVELSKKTNVKIRGKERRQRLYCHRVLLAPCARYRLTEGWYTTMHGLSARDSYDNNSLRIGNFELTRKRKKEIKRKKEKGGGDCKNHAQFMKIEALIAMITRSIKFKRYQ